ncbi:MAG: serine hydrolase [Bacilli bacterium]|nr:serine hydrolase [Bacilli bacterium]
MEQFLYNELVNLTSSGSKVDSYYLKQLKEKLYYIKKLDCSPSESVKMSTKELIQDTTDFLLMSGAINGISSSIYMPTKEEYKINIMGGNIKEGNNVLNITNKTLFDVASITKFFTCLLTLKLEELGYLDFDSTVASINSDFSYLDNYQIKDIIAMAKVIETDERIDESNNVIEAYERLKTVKLKDNTEKHKYTDIGLIILSYIIEGVVNKKSNTKMSYDEIMDKYVLKPLGLKETTYHPERIVVGNGNSDNLPNDPKCRSLNHPIGSAGLFTTTHDLEQLAENLYQFKFIAKEKLLKLGSVIYEDENKGYFGAYVKHPLGIQKTFTPNEYSNNSFSFQGSTGSVVVFDVNNKIHNSVLVNSIMENGIDKKSYFMDTYDKYHKSLIKTSLELLLIKKYYENYVKVKEKVYQKVLI